MAVGVSGRSFFNDVCGVQGHKQPCPWGGATSLASGTSAVQTKLFFSGRDVCALPAPNFGPKPHGSHISDTIVALPTACLVYGTQRTTHTHRTRALQPAVHVPHADTHIQKKNAAPKHTQLQLPGQRHSPGKRGATLQQRAWPGFILHPCTAPWHAFTHPSLLQQSRRRPPPAAAHAAAPAAQTDPVVETKRR